MVEAWCDSRGNTGEPKTNQKSVPYKMSAPSFISRPQARSSSKLVSYRLDGLDICLTCTYPTCPGNPKGFGEENLVPGLVKISIPSFALPEMNPK